MNAEQEALHMGWLMAGKLAALWKSTAAASIVSSVLAFSWTEAKGGNTTDAFLVAAISGAIGAICATVPRLILAVKESRESLSRIHTTETNNLIARIHEIHKQESDALKETVHWAQNQAALTRLSKHAALSECYRLGMRCVLLEGSMRADGVVIPEEKKPLRDLQEVLAEEDNAMRAMLDSRVEGLSLLTRIARHEAEAGSRE